MEKTYHFSYCLISVNFFQIISRVFLFDVHNVWDKRLDILSSCLPKFFLKDIKLQKKKKTKPILVHILKESIKT